MKNQFSRIWPLQEPPTLNPLEIEEILSQILGNLKLPDLKNARLASVFWDSQSSKYICKRGVTKLNWNFPNVFNPPSFLLPHVRIDITRFEENSSHAQTFFQVYQNSSKIVKKLQLENWRPSYESPYLIGQLQYIRDILKESKQIDTLSIDLCLSYRHTEELFLLADPTLELTSLKRLELVHLDATKGNGQDHEALLIWGKQLLKICCNITTLKFVSSWHCRPTIAPICKKLLCSEEDIEEIEKFLPNLEAVEIDRGEKPLLGILLNINHSLKKIDFGWLGDPMCYDHEEHYERLEEVPVIQEIIEKHSQTLVVLKLKISVHNDQSMFEMPFLPNLQELFIHTEKKRSSKLSNCDVLNFSELFKSKAHLQRKLPKLTNMGITFSGNFMENWELQVIYDLIFSQSFQVFPKITTLRLSYMNDKMMCKRFVQKLVIMFPNVKNNHFNWGRQLNNK